MTKKYYLAGPMSGIPQSNFPLFFEVAEKLRKQHYTIISPAELDDEKVKAETLAGVSHKHLWGDYLSRDVKIIAEQVQGIVFLPGWECSRGARLEATVGLLQKDFTFLQWNEWEQIAVPMNRVTVACMLHVELVK